MRRLALLFALLPFVVSAQESITVERVLVDARVTDFDGKPIRELQPKDFRVRIDGKDALIESVTWVPDTPVARSERVTSPITSDAPPPPPPPGRVMVFLVQTDFARNPLRASGQMRFANMTRTSLIDIVEPGDRVAVLSLDSHLKFRLDFTDDKAAITDALNQTMRIDNPPAPAAAAEPSLTSRLDAQKLRLTSTPEQAMKLLGDALRDIPGAKSLMLCGWGFGYYYARGNWVTQGPDYDRAAEALRAARVSVFSLDLPEGYHSLFVSLRRVAEETGGFYGGASYITYNRLRATLSGHYELEVRPGTAKRGAHSISVKLPGRNVHVMARSGYEDAS